MKKTLSTLLFLAVALTATANPVTPKRAATVAENFWQSLNSSPKLGEVAQRTGGVCQLTQQSWQYDAIYLFVGDGGGFVLVAADDAARPILGYSTTGTFDTARMNPALRLWLEGYQRQLSALPTQHVGTDANPEWVMIEHGLMPKDDSVHVVEPLIATFWDQDYPYNAFCPQGTVTGCAATAQAQIMNFWQHPAFGKGSHKYTHAVYGTQEADFAHTPYDWAYMPVQATMNSTDREKEAVATLMYHCGVSLDMNYGTAAQGGSSALGLAEIDGYPTINNVLRDYFYYSPAMRVVNKDDGYTNDQWRDLLKAELDEGRPMVYAGQGSAGGHGFICDGYDSRGYMHFNFGWSGTGDGYYPVDNIAPGTGGAGGGSYRFNDNNSALLNLVPEYGVRVSDSIVCIGLAGGLDSVLFCSDPTVNTIMTVACDADWLTVLYSDTMPGYVLRFQATENNSGDERVALITLSQGTHQCTVRVVQGAYAPEELCPVTVVMESTHGDGWQGGAYLSFESENGFLYGTAQLEASQKDSVTIPVAPHNVHSVWHKGGGTDRYINYYVRNQHGETLVSAPYAYRNGGNHLIEWPCAHLSVEEPLTSTVTLYPSPVRDILNISADGLQTVEVMDMTGRRVATSHANSIDLGKMPAGAYFVRITTVNGSMVKRVVKK